MTLKIKFYNGSEEYIDTDIPNFVKRYPLERMQDVMSITIYFNNSKVGDINPFQLADALYKETRRRS